MGEGRGIFVKACEGSSVELSVPVVQSLVQFILLFLRRGVCVYIYWTCNGSIDQANPKCTEIPWALPLQCWY